MDTRLDWLSFTLETDANIIGVNDLYYAAKGLLKNIGDYHAQYIFNGTGFDNETGRAPYRFAIARIDNGVKIFGGGPHTSILFELSGRACDGLHDYDMACRFIGGVVERLTRMDIATDINTRTKPADFANQRDNQRFRSIGFVRSTTGETCNIGSPKSDRFARVYRYFEPHPRHRLLRVEHVFRRELARVTAHDLLAAGSWERFIGLLTNTYQWRHPDWQPEVVTDEALTTVSRSRMSDGTVNWLYTQVAPAMRRLLREDALNMTDFLEYVYNNGE